MDVYEIYSHLGTEGLILRIWVLHMVPAPFIYLFFKKLLLEKASHLFWFLSS